MFVHIEFAVSEKAIVKPGIHRNELEKYICETSIINFRQSESCL